MPISIRPLADTDLKSVEKILRLAFQRTGNWITDLRLYRRIQPNGYFLAEEDGCPVGIVGAVIYSTYAYVGLMAVHPESQRKGIGLALMQHVLGWLDEQHIPCVLLDASPAGQSLYEKLGFVSYEKVEILKLDIAPPAHSLPRCVQPITVSDLDRIIVPDKKAFGADRSRVLRLLLEMYPDRAFLLPDADGHVGGYLFAQESRIGPWVMQEGNDAEVLLQAALSIPFAGPITVTVPGENVEAMALLQRYGFHSERMNRHMGKGVVAPIGQRAMVFGQASLSLG